MIDHSPQPRQPWRITHGYFLGAAISWGTSWPLTKYFTTRMNPVHVTFFEMLGSTILVSAVLMLRRPPSIGAHNRRAGFAVGLIEPGAATVLFIGGVALSSAAAGALINSLQSFLSALLGAVFLRERVPRSLWIYLIVGCAGVATALQADASPSPGSGSLIGNCAIFAGTLAAAVYTVLITLVDAEADAVAVTWYQNCGALMLVGFLEIFYRFAPIPRLHPVYAQADARLICEMLGLGVLANGLPFILFTSGLRHAPLSRGALYLALIPIVTIVVSTLFFNEGLTVTAALGAAVTVLCVALGAGSRK